MAESPPSSSSDSGCPSGSSSLPRTIRLAYSSSGRSRAACCAWTVADPRSKSGGRWRNGFAGGGSGRGSGGGVSAAAAVFAGGASDGVRWNRRNRPRAPWALSQAVNRPATLHQNPRVTNLVRRRPQPNRSELRPCRPDLRLRVNLRSNLLRRAEPKYCSQLAPAPRRRPSLGPAATALRAFVLRDFVRPAPRPTRS